MSSHTANQRPLSQLWFVGILAGLFLSLTSPTWAASVCYEEKYYPAVGGLEKTATGVRAYLGGKFFQNDRSHPKTRPALTHSEEADWKQDKPFPCGENPWCLPKKQQGKPNVPPITLSKKEAVALVPRLQEAEAIAQDVSAWIEHNGAIWFGISFYAGEGTDGVGGIGQYDPKTGQTVIRRPKALLESSINHIVHDGQRLWLGTTGYYECVGEPPDHGLMRYEWDADQIETFEGQDDGPCGFVVHDLLLEKKYLWAATDLGLSRWDRQAKKWAHYVPDPAGSPPMRPTTCAALYSDLLKTLPRTFDPQYDFIFHSQLFDLLKRFRPRFLKDYVQEMLPTEWGCDELKFLAGGARDFQTFKAALLSVRPVGSPHLKCAIEGFGGKNSRDPEWRNLLLSSFEKPGEKGEYRDEVILRLLSGFPGDTKVGEALVNRLKTAPNPWEEAELLPAMLGKKSVLPLIEAFDRFTDWERSGHIRRAIVRALVQATHLSISPNGAIQPVPPNADHDRYEVSEKALPHVISRWKQWWEVHKAEYGAGPARPQSQQPDRGAVSTATRIEPTVLLSAPTSPLSIGMVFNLTASVKNLAAQANPPLPNFPLSFHVTDGPHADRVKPFRGVTDAKGTLTFHYSGTKSGIDTITVWHEGDDVFLDENHAKVAWGGPDLVVPLFVPPVLMSGGGKTFFATDWTQNTGSFPAAASTTRYFLSATHPVDPAKARVVGERAVPALGPGEQSAVKQLQFVLPSELPAGIYYLAACADVVGAVLESDESNNCSSHKSPGHSSMVVPLRPSETPLP